MSKVIARKYRPQTFRQVLGQETTVTTLKNAIRQKRLANAYLFSGSRGTGKTTLARILAKALNCFNPQNEEPCNECASCREITAGYSLDVLEIDGASHRGIEDIRQINETVSYASSNKYKIYLIDEVHMLTKEAFNALLKTLEEPPENVIFLFATTEPHKVLPTILSRCQRFQLNRIPLATIIEKLSEIANDLNIQVEPKALHLIAGRAEGGLRDAESLLDQIISFHGESITEEVVASSLGLVSKDLFFEIDGAAKEGDLGKAFEVSELIFSQGKDFIQFTEALAEHFRLLLEIKLSQGIPEHLSILKEEYPLYLNSAAHYSKENLLHLLEELIDAMNEIRFAPNSRIYLERLLLNVLRSHRRVPIEHLVKRLSDLEETLLKLPFEKASFVGEETRFEGEETRDVLPLANEPQTKLAPTLQQVKATSGAEIAQERRATSFEREANDPPTFQEVKAKRAAETQKANKEENKVKEPMPLVRPPQTSAPRPIPQPPPKPVVNNEILTPRPSLTKEQESRFDTILQFMAVELEGKIEKHP